MSFLQSVNQQMNYYEFHLTINGLIEAIAKLAEVINLDPIGLESILSKKQKVDIPLCLKIESLLRVLKTNIFNHNDQSPSIF